MHTRPDSAHLSRPTAVGRLGALVSAHGRQALGRGKAFTLAFSSRVQTGALQEALVQATGEVRGLAEAIHLFASDLGLAPVHEDRRRLEGLRARLGLRATQVHVPEETGDVLSAARAFESDIRRHFRLSGGGLPAFDALVLSPEDFAAPRHAEAADRLATSFYNVATGLCSVSLTFASLGGARAVACFGPARPATAESRMPTHLASRAEILHWDPRHEALPLS